MMILFSQQTLGEIHPRKLRNDWLDMNEDVFPIENGGFSNVIRIVPWNC